MTFTQWLKRDWYFVFIVIWTVVATYYHSVGKYGLVIFYAALILLKTVLWIRNSKRLRLLQEMEKFHQFKNGELNHIIVHVPKYEDPEKYTKHLNTLLVIRIDNDEVPNFILRYNTTVHVVVEYDELKKYSVNLIDKIYKVMAESDEIPTILIPCTDAINVANEFSEFLENIHMVPLYIDGCHYIPFKRKEK